MAKEARMLVSNLQSGSGETGLQQATSHSANARMPRGDTTAHQVAEVPGAALDAHWLHAASGVFFANVCVTGHT